MFRKPRMQESDEALRVQPSVGRPPTPPSGMKTAGMPRTMSKSRGQQARLSTYFAKNTGPAPPPAKAKPTNHSILKFFGKVDAPAHLEQSLFLDEGSDELGQFVRIDDKENIQFDTA